MKDEEWRTLYENFETMDLIYAVDRHQCHKGQPIYG